MVPSMTKRFDWIDIYLAFKIGLYTGALVIVLVGVYHG
jgi:hypothetical protein